MERFFTTHVIDGEFIIREEFDASRSTVSRENAWDQARGQRKPVVFVGLDDQRKPLGVVYNLTCVTNRRP